MGLDSTDPRPQGISARDAYAAIWTWYQANFGRDKRHDKYAIESKAYVQSMPKPDIASEKDMFDAFRQVLSGKLEWAYHASDGKYKMAAYAEVGRDRSNVGSRRPGS